MEYLIEGLGIAVLTAATFVGRKKESKINLFGDTFYIIITLMVIGIFLIKSSDNLLIIFNQLAK